MALSAIISRPLAVLQLCAPLPANFLNTRFEPFSVKATHTKFAVTPKCRDIKLSRAVTPSAPVTRKKLPSNKQQLLRAQIIVAGMELFLRNGFEATTVAEIADAAGTSRRTFFRYFESKDDVVFDWLNESSVFVNQQLDAQAPGTTPLPAMRDALLKLAQHLDADHANATLLTRIVFDTPSLSRRYHAENARWEGEITKRLAGSMQAADVFALRVQISVCTAVFVAAMRAWAADNHCKPLRIWVAAAFLALIKGLAELPPEISKSKTMSENPTPKRKPAR